MTKKPKKSGSRAQPPPRVPPWPPFAGGAFPVGMQFIQLQPPPSEPRMVTKEEVNVSVFTLEDGTQIMVSPKVQGVSQMIGQVSPTGDPVYSMQISWTFEIKKASEKNKVKSKE
jgi:hypothetical protein